MSDITKDFMLAIKQKHKGSDFWLVSFTPDLIEYNYYDENIVFCTVKYTGDHSKELFN